MCGICGYVGDHRPELLEPMCLAMAHRGPDDQGAWADEVQQVGLGHRRLSIIDLSPAGHQPMSNEDGSIWLAYNGEVYNFQEHRERLTAKGHTFRGHSDTEVLVHLYEEKGEDFLKELNGIFALALWDSNRRRLLLARDHAGIKPLYYWRDGRRLFFASEIKALLRVPGVPRRLNARKVPEFLRFLWVPGEETMFEGIRKLEPGHYMTWQDGQTETRLWFRLAYEPDDSVCEAEWVERVHDGLLGTIRRQMVSDVPLGAFLSGGADSSSIVACMRRMVGDRPITCYTASFRPGDMVRDQFVEDYPYARKVADHLGVHLKSFEFRADMISLLPKMIYHMDEPDADPAAIPSYLISKFAREDGTTVLLSGTGGDEVFLGYRSHQAYRQYSRIDWLPRWLTGPPLRAMAAGAALALGSQSALARRLSKFRRGLLARGLERHLELADWSSPQIRDTIFASGFGAALGDQQRWPACMQKYWDAFEGTGELNRHSHLLTQTFLAAHNFLYTDKTSMATSIEVRVPFMDVELMRLAARIPERYKLCGSVTKYVLKKAMERYLPPDILYRSKTGFGAPLRKWVAEDLRPTIGELLGPSRLVQRGIFQPQVVERLLREHEANKADHAYLIYALLTLELWLQTFIDRPGVEVAL